MKNAITPARAKASITRKTVLMESSVSFLKQIMVFYFIYNEKLIETNCNRIQNLYAIIHCSILTKILASLIKYFTIKKIGHMIIFEFQ